MAKSLDQIFFECEVEDGTAWLEKYKFKRRGNVYLWTHLHRKTKSHVCYFCNRMIIDPEYASYMTLHCSGNCSLDINWDPDGKLHAKGMMKLYPEEEETEDE